MSGFRFAFFSWEDLPSIRETMVHRSREERIALAGATGYRAFLRSRFELAQISQLFGEAFRDFVDVYIPLPNGEAYRTYNEFVNRALAGLLMLGRTVNRAHHAGAGRQPVNIGGKIVWLRMTFVPERNMRVSYYCLYIRQWRQTLSGAIYCRIWSV